VIPLISASHNNYRIFKIILTQAIYLFNLLRFLRHNNVPSNTGWKTRLRQ